MKIILSPRRRHYTASVSISLITVALIAGIVGCSGGGGSVWYDLTIASTAGGSVTTPGEGTFTYKEGTVVSLVAQAEDGYYFVNWTGDVNLMADVNGATTTITMNGDYSIKANFRVPSTPMVAAVDLHTVGLKKNGMVVAVGYNERGQCNVGEWTNIVQVTAGAYHTVGLKADGTVVAVGADSSGQCRVGGWTNITRVAAGSYHTVGLKADGTVVAVGKNYNGECEVSGWTNITQLTAGNYHTLGLKVDATVVAVGSNDHGQCDVSGWTNITQVTAGRWHTVGLKADGTVIAVGSNDHGQCNVSGWILN